MYMLDSKHLSSYMNFNGSFEINKYQNKGYIMLVNDSTAFY